MAPRDDTWYSRRMHPVSDEILAREDLPTSTRRWLDRAAKIAIQEAHAGNYHLGAVIVRGGSMLSTGSNRSRNYLQWDLDSSPPVVPRHAWSFCAEERCLRAAKNAEGSTLYVARVTPGGQWGLARPCRKCATLAFEAGVSRIVYTSGGSLVESVRARDLIGERLRVYA